MLFFMTMSTLTLHPPTVLAVSVPQIRLSDSQDLTYTFVRTGGEAIERMRMDKFDLMLIGSALPDFHPCLLVQQIRQVFPWQRCAIISGGMSMQEEATARVLGAFLFDTIPDAARLRRVALPARPAPKDLQIVGQPPDMPDSYPIHGTRRLA